MMATIIRWRRVCHLKHSSSVVGKQWGVAVRRRVTETHQGAEGKGRVKDHTPVMDTPAGQIS